MSANPTNLSNPASTNLSGLKSVNLFGRSQVNINEASEIRHWMQHWNVSEAELRRAIAEVGPEIDDVRIALGR
jgi:hypothetical protein